MQWNAIHAGQCTRMQCSAMQCNTIQYNAMSSLVPFDVLSKSCHLSMRMLELLAVLLLHCMAALIGSVSRLCDAQELKPSPVPRRSALGRHECHEGSEGHEGHEGHEDHEGLAAPERASRSTCVSTRSSRDASRSFSRSSRILSPRGPRGAGASQVEP